MTDKEIRISIIVPIYNIELYVRKCIDSILQQTYKNIEIILVDDGSTDKCKEICDQYVKIDSRIEVIHKENGGLVSARKAGASIASGQWIINVDGDDWIEKDYVQRYVDAIDMGEYDIIWSLSYKREYEGVSYICGKKLTENLDKKEKQHEYIEKAMGKYGYRDELSYYLCLKCIKRDLYMKAQLSLNDEICYAEDLSCMVRCLAYTNNICFIDNHGYHYMQNAKSISHVQGKRELKKLNVMREDTLNYLARTDKYAYLSGVVEGAYISATVVKCFSEIQSESEDFLVPFKNVKKGSQIIIYGMGNVGKKIANYISEHGDYTLVACVDERKIEAKNKWNILTINEIKKTRFDVVLIATVKREFIDDIKEKLIAEGIEKEKIAYLIL